MSIIFSLLLLLLFTTTTTSLHHLQSINSSTPSPSPSHQPPPPPLISKPTPPKQQQQQQPQPPSQPPSPSMNQQQLKNILDALIGSGDFAAWANILFNPTNTSTTTTLPTTATLFIPSNTALSRLSATPTGTFSFDPFIIPYHILPQRLTFSNLQLFNTHTRLPTLLPSKTILITNNAPHHFTIDDSLIIQPDVYTNEAVCVHGVENVLDYKLYGDAGLALPSFVAPQPLPPLVPADETETVATPPEVVGSTGVVWFLDFLISFVVTVLVLYVIS